MPCFVARLGSELARLAHVIAIALDFLLRLGEIALRRLQAARRELADLGFIGLRDQCASFVENAALDCDQLRFTQQHFRFSRAALRILGVVLLALGHRVAKTLSSLLPCLRRVLRCFCRQCIFARFDHGTEELSRGCGGGSRAAQCGFAFLHSRADLVGIATAACIFDRCFVRLHGVCKILGSQSVDLLGARFIERSGQRGRIQVLCSMSSAGQRQQGNEQSTQKIHGRTCPEPRTMYL